MQGLTEDITKTRSAGPLARNSVRSAAVALSAVALALGAATGATAAAKPAVHPSPNAVVYAYAMHNVVTGHCVDDSVAGLRSFVCNGQNFQHWKIQYNSDSTKTFINVNTGRCMDDSVAYGLRSFVCNNQNFQRFDFR